MQQIHSQAYRPDIDAAQPGTDLRQSARHGRRNPRQYEDDGGFLGPCRPKRSSGGHRRIARDDPDLSEKQAEDEVSLIGLVISLLDRGNYDGRPRTGRPANEPTSLPGSTSPRVSTKLK